VSNVNIQVVRSDKESTFIVQDRIRDITRPVNDRIPEQNVNEQSLNLS
jgi:hypothetical protein